MFGVSSDRLEYKNTTHSCIIDVEDGDVVYITGPSGAGKSVLLRELERSISADERISIDEISLPADKAAIDCIGFTAETAPCLIPAGAGENAEKKQNNSCSSASSCPAAGLTTIEAMRFLSYAGLSDVFCMLTAPADLSEGQQYRFRLARALAAGKRHIFADEFCSNLDRITAAVIAYNICKFAKMHSMACARNKVTFFLASSHEDILADLQPDVLIVKHFTGPAEVSYKKLRI
jgi:ABC-type ATPase with predicted acetyltransferase domain